MRSSLRQLLSRSRLSGSSRSTTKTSEANASEKSSEHNRSVKGKELARPSRDSVDETGPAQTLRRLTHRRASSDSKATSVSLSDVSETAVPAQASDRAVQVRPCFCEPRVAVTNMLTRWDNLLVVLVCATVIVLVLTAPVSFFLGRNSNNNRRT